MPDYYAECAARTASLLRSFPPSQSSRRARPSMDTDRRKRPAKAPVPPARCQLSSLLFRLSTAGLMFQIGKRTKRHPETGHDKCGARHQDSGAPSSSLLGSVDNRQMNERANPQGDQRHERQDARPTDEIQKLRDQGRPGCGNFLPDALFKGVIEGRVQTSMTILRCEVCIHRLKRLEKFSARGASRYVTVRTHAFGVRKFGVVEQQDLEFHAGHLSSSAGSILLRATAS